MCLDMCQRFVCFLLENDRTVVQQIPQQFFFYDGFRWWMFTGWFFFFFFDTFQVRADTERAREVIKQASNIDQVKHRGFVKLNS